MQSSMAAHCRGSSPMKLLANGGFQFSTLLIQFVSPLLQISCSGHCVIILSFTILAFLSSYESLPLCPHAIFSSLCWLFYPTLSIKTTCHFSILDPAVRLLPSPDASMLHSFVYSLCGTPSHHPQYPTLFLPRSATSPRSATEYSPNVPGIIQ